MRRVVFLFAIFAATALSAFADEGMWLINDADAGMYRHMRRMGLKLKAGDIYGGGDSSLSDAVVSVNGGAGTGSMISDEGLMITNHHVAYAGICRISTPERNILETGFWAPSRGEEIPLEGYTVSFLRGIIDVTEEAASLRDSLAADGRAHAMVSRRLAREMERRYAGRTEYTPSFEPMWGGKRSYIYLYETFRDVRLVAAPPERLGAFGGDADNWNWPQHKADFAICRIYGDSAGRPADYSAGNVPIRPRRRLHVAGKGVREGDFTMVIGYPGRTSRYISSFAVGERETVRNPVVIDARHRRMDIIREGMERNDTVRMNYSDRYFNLSNYADQAKWENVCLRRFGVRGMREEEECGLQAWIEADSARKSAYGGLLARLGRGYEARAEAMKVRTDYAERWFGVSEAQTMASRMLSGVNRLKQRGEYLFDLFGDPQFKAAVNSLGRLEKADSTVDRTLFVEICGDFLDSVPADYLSDDVSAQLEACGGDSRAMLGRIYDASFCRSAETVREFFAKPRRIREVLSDPLVELVSGMLFPKYVRRVFLAEKGVGASVAADERTYASLLYDFREAEGVRQYPDANSTMRLSYGKVCPLSPRDGVHYDWQSTTAGYVEKADGSEHAFRPDGKMLEMVSSLDRPMRMNFITDNDITGGNSGSPVLNGRGELVGLAFDGNRESMSGDIRFHPQYSRTVCVDIGYVMWLLENHAPESLCMEILR